MSGNGTDLHWEQWSKGHCQAILPSGSQFGGTGAIRCDDTGVLYLLDEVAVHTSYKQGLRAGMPVSFTTRGLIAVVRLLS